MPEPVLNRYTVNGLDVTTVVMDQADFDALIDEIAIKPMQGFTAESWKTVAEGLRTSQHIPLVVRGAKTEWLFTRFNIESQQAGFIVRGCGAQIAETYTTRTLQQIAESN